MSLLILLLFGPFALVILRGNPKVAIWSYIAIIFLPITAIEQQILGSSTMLRNLPYLFLALLLLITFISRARPIRNAAGTFPPHVLTALGIMAGVTLTSGFLNNSSLLLNLFSLRWMIVLFGTIYLLSLYFPPQSRSRLLKILIIIGLLQVPVTLLQRIVLVNILNVGLGDFVTGVFPKFHHLAFYQIACFIIVLCHKLEGVRLTRLNDSLVLGLLIIPLVLSNSKASWLYLVLVLGLIFMYSKLNWATVIKYSIVSLALILAGLFAFNSLYKKNYAAQNLEYITDVGYIARYTIGGFSSVQGLLDKVEAGEETIAYFGRVGSIVINFLNISRSPSTLLLGLGPQQRLESVTSTFDVNVLAGGTYILGNTISRTLGGYGLIGIGALGFLMLSFYRWASKEADDRPEIVRARKIMVIFICSMLIYYNIISAFSTALVLGVLFLKGEEAGAS